VCSYDIFLVSNLGEARGCWHLSEVDILDTGASRGESDESILATDDSWVGNVDSNVKEVLGAAAKAGSVALAAVWRVPASDLWGTS